jgi:hypothetical protein
MKAKREFICFTLPPQALTRAGFKGISQLHKQSLISTPGELNLKNIITLFIELSKVKYSHSECTATCFSKMKFKTAKPIKTSKIKGLIDAHLRGECSHVPEKKKGGFGLIVRFSRYACVARPRFATVHEYWGLEALLALQKIQRNLFEK